MIKLDYIPMQTVIVAIYAITTRHWLNHAKDLMVL